METQSKSILVIGFNSRPLAQSLDEAGYQVYVVDFFGDLDLFPHAKDAFIITKELRTNYNLIRNDYSSYLVEFGLEMLKKYPNIDYLLIGSGLDDDIDGRNEIYNALKKLSHACLSLNNDSETVRKSRDILNIYDQLKSVGYKMPRTLPFLDYETNKEDFAFPLILKKIGSSGGLSVFKIEDHSQLEFRIKVLKSTKFNPENWILQEYLDGIPVSCTVISNGNEARVITINRQIIGQKFVYPPKEFIYCGNTVPGYLLAKDNDLISKISLYLAKSLRLKGINGFDFVIKNHYPYLMEINPRIPGSIRASEDALDVNLLDIHVKSFIPECWDMVKERLDFLDIKGFSTKFIFFSPCRLDSKIIKKINALEYVHDKSEPSSSIFRGDPVCTILYKAKSFSDSYFGALKIINTIKDIIEKKE